MAEKLEDGGLVLTAEEVESIRGLMMHASGAVLEMSGILVAVGALRLVNHDTMKATEQALYAVTKIVDPDIYEEAKSERNKMISAMGMTPSDV